MVMLDSLSEPEEGMTMFESLLDIIFAVAIVVLVGWNVARRG
jgi:hypothetical protein